MDRRTKIREFLLGIAILAMLLGVVMAPGDQPVSEVTAIEAEEAP